MSTIYHLLHTTCLPQRTHNSFIHFVFMGLWMVFRIRGKQWTLWAMDMDLVTTCVHFLSLTNYNKLPICHHRCRWYCIDIQIVGMLVEPTVSMLSQTVDGYDFFQSIPTFFYLGGIDCLDPIEFCMNCRHLDLTHVARHSELPENKQWTLSIFIQFLVNYEALLEIDCFPKLLGGLHSNFIIPVSLKLNLWRDVERNRSVIAWYHFLCSALLLIYIKVRRKWGKFWKLVPLLLKDFNFNFSLNDLNFCAPPCDRFFFPFNACTHW